MKKLSDMTEKEIRYGISITVRATKFYVALEKVSIHFMRMRYLMHRDLHKKISSKNVNQKEEKQ